MMSRFAPVFLAGVIAFAVVGYFVGITDGVPQPDGVQELSLVSKFDQETRASNRMLIPAVAYSQMADTFVGPTKAWQAIPQALSQPKFDPYIKIEPSGAEKKASSLLRASRRAYSGAPPIIPHPVENTSDAACYACHSNGLQLAGLKASVMSHPFLGNCLQCHAPLAPAPFQHIDAAVDSSFVGLPAPTDGKRAYQGAPPTIPHALWMRENCNACHGGPQGWAGMESTHPWRSNCTQCHALSASLNQMPVGDAVPMLPPLDVVAN